MRRRAHAITRDMLDVTGIPRVVQPRVPALSSDLPNRESFSSSIVLRVWPYPLQTTYSIRYTYYRYLMEANVSDMQSATESPTDAARQALDKLLDREPQRHPLIIGFVGAIGIRWQRILSAFEESLKRFDYESTIIHLSQLADNLTYSPWGDLPNAPSLDYYVSRMDACDRLRADVQSGSALAALAVGEIYEHRSQQEELKPQAYLLKSLKHPAEVILLRHVYGDAFSLVAVASSARERRDSLAELLSTSITAPNDSRADAERLIGRDQSDSGNRDYGQNVRDTYSMADVFIPIGRGVEIITDIDRFIDAAFGAPFITPSSDEEGMKFAHTSALRSAAAGRQVGAALIPEMGTPIVAGVNEVPKPGGGQYWTGDSPDYRDFRTGEDSNPIYIKRVIQEIFERLVANDWLIEELCQLSSEELVVRAFEPDESGNAVLAGTRASSLIEFTRCLHAEQAAIINAARAGVSTQEATMFTTTFPCHECAKIIVGAGIQEVHYIEPYPKSLVDSLYRDVIETSPLFKRPGSTRAEQTKIPFYQFFGIAPRRYTRYFEATERKLGDQLVAFDRRGACPQTSGWLEHGVAEREETTSAAITRILDSLVVDLVDYRSEGVSEKRNIVGSIPQRTSSVDER